ncbi:MAG: N-formylglutamate amidohydrolase [Pseudomonadota bacterium]
MLANVVESKDAVHVLNAQGTSRFVLVCEHASHFIPHVFNHLGLAPKDRQSHAAWDPGALGVARRLAVSLGARLVAGGISRLVYDANRPPDAPDAVPTRSEQIEVPGNQNLTRKDRAARTAAVYQPFTETLERVLNDTSDPILVTMHSFTPVYFGERRTVDIGLLHHDDTRLTDAMLHLAPQHSTLDVRRNEPYGPKDGVTHTLIKHGDAERRPNVMIEIRNDLIATPMQQAGMADTLSPWISAAAGIVLMSLRPT